MCPNDVLEMDDDHVVSCDVLTIEELPDSIVLMNDVDDRSTIKGNPPRRHYTRRRWVGEGPGIGLGDACPSTHRVLILRQPQLWLVEHTPLTAPRIPGESSKPVGPYDLDDGQWWLLCEPERVPEELRVPRVINSAKNDWEARKDSRTWLIRKKELPGADLFAHVVEPSLHIPYAETEHRDLGAPEGVPQTDAEGPAGQTFIRFDPDDRPPMPLDVSDELPVTVVPRSSVVGRLVNDAVTVAVQSARRRAHIVGLRLPIPWYGVVLQNRHTATSRRCVATTLTCCLAGATITETVVDTARVRSLSDRG